MPMGDVFEMLQDFLLGVTQWHILTYMKVLNQFMDNQEAYLKIYRVVGELDARSAQALSERVASCDSTGI